MEAKGHAMKIVSGFKSGRLGALLASIALLTAPNSQAQTLDFGSCTRVDDSTARLACYDRAAGRPSMTTAPPAATAGPVRTAPVAPPAPAAPPAAVDPVAKFGAADTVVAKRQASVEKDEVKQVEAKVAAVRKRATGQHILTLDNGQVWEQTETRSEPQYAVGDVVVIRRGLLGSFILTLAKGSPSSRARRIS
jgi:hypothetical protein